MKNRMGWGLLGLFLLVFCASASVNRGELSSVDEGFIQRTTEELARRGSWQIEELSDRVTSRFGVLPSLWGVPWFLMGDAVVRKGTDRAVWLLWWTQLGSCAATALTAVLLAGWLRNLGYSVTNVLITALLYALGSLAFPYSSTLFHQITSTPLLLLCCWSITILSPGWSMLTAALLVFGRPDFSLLLGAAILALVADIKEQRQQSWTTVVGLTLGVLVGGVGAALLHHGRGDPIIQGAYNHETFTTPLWIGLTGLLVSPGKGLAWFAPLAFIGLLGLIQYTCERSRPGRMLLAITVVHLLVTAQWWAWHGSLCLGPRLLLPLLPLWYVPVADWLENWLIQPAWQRRLFVLTALGSVALNLEFACHSQLAFVTDFATSTVEAENIYIPHTGPFAALEGSFSALLWRTADSPVIWSARFLLLGGIGAGCLLLWFVMDKPRWSGACWRNERGFIFYTVLLSVVAFGPQLVHRIFPTHGKNFQPKSMTPTMYRAWQPQAGGTSYRGQLFFPLRGTYTLYGDLRMAMGISLDNLPPKPLPLVVEQKQSGTREVVILGASHPPGRLFWTLPGSGQYKQPIPTDYFLPAHPTWWHYWKIFWRHYGWLFWLPLTLPVMFSLLQPHVMKEDTARPRNPQ